MMLHVVGVLVIPAILQACSPLPPGQQKEIALKVDGITLPMEFTYSQTPNVTETYPMVQATSEQAVANLQKYVKRTVSQAIKKMAEDLGFGGFVTEIGKQIKAAVYYNPMLCYAMEPKPATGTPMPTYISGIGNFCLSQGDAVTNVLYDIKAEPIADIPEQYQRFMVILAIRNFVVSTWSTNYWELAMVKVQSQLRKGAYGEYFKSAEVTMV